MNVVKLVRFAAKYNSKKTAVICGGKKRTFIEIEKNSNRFANGLLNLGIRKGDRVALYADNSVEYFEAIFGLFKSGIVGVGVNTMLSPTEALLLINDSGAKVVVTSSQIASGLDSYRSELPHVEEFVCIGESPGNMINFTEFIRGQKSSSIDVELKEGDLAQLFYTGGTTGIPKGVMITHKIVNHVLMNMQSELCPMTPYDTVLSPGSLAHANGYYSLLAFIKGAKLIVPEGYDPLDVLNTIEKERVTILPGYPTTLIRLIDHPDIEKSNISSLKRVTYGASPMPVEKLRKALDIFGYIIAQGYGQAEALMTVTYLSPEDHAYAVSSRPERLMACGRPYLTQEVRIVDNQDMDVHQGGIGEVVTKGSVCTKGYWNNSKATEDTIKDGWVHTGDIGWMDEEGYVYLLDRKKDVVISGGENVYAREVEDVLNAHPAVAEAAIIGVPDEVWGEAVKAVVAVKPGLEITSGEIIQYCKEKLSSFKKPKSVDFVKELPKTAANKIDKKIIREPYWSSRERKI